ncbi:TnsD family Tn7-like transposition protein [Niallia sp. Sow4_A1]|uniref:TnsD family Tn7-like transposition protein n=1 Tax=Niallia hominis TaxID=3133173 RepID=A0ABV1F6Y7_9BACI
MTQSTSDDGKKIYMQSGIMASSIPQNRFLRYCSACAEEDIATYGEMYWHRIHQLPGNLICTKHELWLEDSDVLITHSNKHAFVLPATSNCHLNRKRKITWNNLIQLKNIVLQAEHLLNRKYQNQPFSHFTQFYRYHLIDKDFASFKGQTKQKLLHEAIYNFYSKELLKNLYIEVGDKEWIANFSRKHRKSFHPYYHLLMLNFLDLDLDAVFKATSFENNPFNNPNWPCLNTTCPDYKENVIPEITIRRCERTKKPIGRFTCPTCGFSYTRKGKDNNKDDRYKFSRIMDFGFLWKRELQTLLNDGLSYREIARILGVDTNTVIKYEKKNIECEQKAKVRIDSDLVKEHRYEWIHLQRDFPGLSKTELRKKRSEVYAYLYRHDGDWLKVNSPKRKKVDPTNNRVNWLERDKEILEKVQKVVSELRGIDKKPVRITVKILGDSIGERALLERHLDKLPETRVFIEQVSESEQDFRLRRVKYVINEMMEKGEVIKEWKVLRKAGIKQEFYEEVLKFLKTNI